MLEKGLLWITKDGPLKEITRFLGALWQELGTKTKYVFLMSQECYSFTAQPQMHILRKQPTPKGYEVYDSIYNDILEKAKLQRHKVDQWLSRSGEGGRKGGRERERTQVCARRSLTTKGHKVVFIYWLWWWLHKYTCLSKLTELYTENNDFYCLWIIPQLTWLGQSVIFIHLKQFHPLKMANTKVM